MSIFTSAGKQVTTTKTKIKIGMFELSQVISKTYNEKLINQK